jgi:hypothetical protein
VRQQGSGQTVRGDEDLRPGSGDSLLLPLLTSAPARPFLSVPCLCFTLPLCSTFPQLLSSCLSLYGNCGCERALTDPHAQVCWEANRLSLQRGSKDNHSCMLISFEDGTAYAKQDEFVAGPYVPLTQHHTA